MIRERNFSMDCSDLRSKTLFLLDMDGTVYLGDRPIDGAVDFIRSLRRRGCEYVFLTNNSSRSAESYLEKLHRLGFEAQKENLFTSGQASARFLQRKKPGAKVYCVGTRSLCAELRHYGLCVTDAPDADTDFLLVGYDTELTYAKLTDACDLLCRDVPFYATNPDRVCPAGNGRYLPDCLTMCAMLTEATGKKPYYIGKPRAAFAEEALREKNRTASEAVLVGDRLYTDIQCGINAGITSVLVLSGESTRQDVDTTGIRPDVIVNSVKDLIF